MQNIHLVSISLENFKSYRSPATINLSQNAGLKLVAGQNLAEPRLGANGAGKSTLFDAVMWCLYNFSTKGDRASELISYGAKSCSVTVSLIINDDAVEISRSNPPNRTSINGKPCEQHDIELLLGLTRLRFQHSVMFGQDVATFIDLSNTERENLLDEILNLDVWMKATKIAGDKADKALAAKNKLEIEFSASAGAIEAKRSAMNNLEKLKLEWAESHDKDIEETVIQLEATEKLRDEYRDLQRELKAPPDPAPLWTATKAKQDELVKANTDMQKTRDLLATLTDSMEFYCENENCPTCKQVITEAFVESKLVSLALHREVATSKLSHEDAALVRLFTEHVKLQDQWKAAVELKSKHAAEEQNLKSTLRQYDATIKSLTDKTVKLLEENNPFDASIESNVVSIAAQEELQTKRAAEISDFASRATRATFWKNEFKNVRLFCIAKVLAEFELETHNAAGDLGLVGWQIKYVTETENKSGTLKSGVQVTVESPEHPGKFNVYSGGEGQRVRLASAQGLSRLIQRWAGVNYFFEVYDEPSAWLSSEGIEDLLECLKNKAEVYDKSLFICDHRALIFSGFSEIWQVTKDKQGSHVELRHRQTLG